MVIQFISSAALSTCHNQPHFQYLAFYAVALQHIFTRLYIPKEPINDSLPVYLHFS